MERDVVVPPVPITPAASNQACRLEHGFLEVDLIARASHSHCLYKTDNRGVYFKIEEVARATIHADYIKTFQRFKDGRAVFAALKKEYAGVDKWESTLKEMDALLHTCRWGGQNSYTLEKFCQNYRNSYVQIRSCTVCVEYQLSYEHTQVGYLIDTIESQDASLLASIANVRDEKGDGTPANPGKKMTSS